MRTGPNPDKCGSTTSARGSPSATDPESVSVDEAVELYPEQWILMRLTDTGYDATQHTGVVVAHAVTRGGIQAKVLKFVTTANDSGSKYSLFFGYRRIRTDAEWDEALARDATRFDRGR